MNEKYETITSIVDYLKNKYNFNPKNMMSDFRMSQIKAIQKCFPHCNIHGCFFHFSQSIWRNFKKYGLGGKGTYSRNHELLLNLQTLCFIEKEKIDKIYRQIKKNINLINIKNFSIIFQEIGWGIKYPKYCGIIMIS